MHSPKLKLRPYQKHLRLQNAQFSLIEHEDAIVAIVYKVTMPNGDEFILKICEHNNHFHREVYFLNALQDKISVPKIIRCLEPKPGIPGAILMEYLSGQVLKKETLTSELAKQAGSELARLHLNKAKGYGDLIKEETLSSDPKAHLIQKFEEGISECQPHLPSPLIEKCRHFFHTHLHLLELADGPCMIHRDFRPGNLIGYEYKLQGIIDWASARAGFTQEDFCSFEMGEWSRHTHIQAAFLAGYETIRPIPNFQEMMPLLKLNRSIAILGYLHREGGWEKTCADLYQSHLQSLESFT